MGWLHKSPEQLRLRALTRTPEGPVRDLLATPFPALDTPLARLPLLAVDLETTGLDPATDRILSIGFAPVDGDTITLAGARHMLVQSEGEVGESATVHGITDDTLTAGIPLRDALLTTLAALRGRALLAHHAKIESDFLAAACRAEFGAGPQFLVVDTLWLGQEYLERTIEAIPRGHLRLFSLRDRFGLPRYRAHDALIDAIACGELYLALTAELGFTHLKQVYSR